MKKKTSSKRFSGFELDKRSCCTSSLSEGMADWFKTHGKTPYLDKLSNLWKNWIIILGEELSSMAHPLGHRNNILLIGGDDPCSMQELSYAIPEILEKVNAFLGEIYFQKIELHLLMGKTSLQRIDITPIPKIPTPPRPPRLGNLQLSPDSPVSACYKAYIRCFEK